jgi:hypothetical protein
MGQTATWVPSDGSHAAGYITAVLFKNPTKGEKINGIEYDPVMAQIEYLEESLPGLGTAVKSGLTEFIEINGVEYLVEKVNAKWDGDITMAELVKRN